MKNTITVICFAVGVILGFKALAPVTAHAAVGPQVTVSDAPVTATVVASPTLIEVPEFKYVAPVLHKHTVAAKAWTCGEMQDLYTGGRAATCEYR